MKSAGTTQFVEQNNIVILKADKSDKHSPETAEINKVLVELGNHSKGIPFYAIYPAGGGKPIVLDGIITESKVISALEEALRAEEVEDAAARTAMRPEE